MRHANFTVSPPTTEKSVSPLHPLLFFAIFCWLKCSISCLDPAQKPLELILYTHTIARDFKAEIIISQYQIHSKFMNAILDVVGQIFCIFDRSMWAVWNEAGGNVGMQPTACCPETGVVHSSLEIFSCKPVNKTYQYSTIRIFILLLLLLLSKYWPGRASIWD